MQMQNQNAQFMSPPLTAQERANRSVFGKTS